MTDDPPPYQSLAEVRYDWTMGRDHGYPVCCRAQYILDVARGRSPANRRGAFIVGYIPCRLHLMWLCRRPDYRHPSRLDIEDDEIPALLDAARERWPKAYAQDTQDTEDS